MLILKIVLEDWDRRNRANIVNVNSITCKPPQTGDKDVIMLNRDYIDAQTYEDHIETFVIYPQNKAIEYLALGLASEVGEVCDKLKKSMRDGYELDKAATCLELGDVLFYLVQLNKALGSNITELMINNINKLESRKNRGVLKGSGDNR